MTLYNCKHSGDQYRISKFDGDMNVESSYLCTESGCECPAGVRPTCRHRQMLPKFLQRGHVGDEWFLDWDRGGWVQMDVPKDEYLTGIMQHDLPKGITAIVMDSPEKVVDVHNAIADAVGENTDHIDWDTMAEERLGQRPPAATHIKRRF